MLSQLQQLVCYQSIRPIMVSKNFYASLPAGPHECFLSFHILPQETFQKKCDSSPKTKVVPGLLDKVFIVPPARSLG